MTPGNPIFGADVTAPPPPINRYPNRAWAGAFHRLDAMLNEALLQPLSGNERLWLQENCRASWANVELYRRLRDARNAPRPRQRATGPVDTPAGMGGLGTVGAIAHGADLVAGIPLTGVTTQAAPAPVPSVKSVNPFLVGADPEFVVLNYKSQLVRADNFWGNRYATEGLGTDHGGRVVELRPNPNRSTYNVLKTMQQMLMLAPRLQAIRDFRWKAGAIVDAPPNTLTLGGHVHLDLPVGGDDEAYTLFGRRVNALDSLTAYLERVDVLPLNESKLRRDRGEYGQFGDIRTTPGSEDQRRREHFEYRTMASWLYSPISAYLCMTAAKLAAVDPEGTVELFGERATSLQKLTEYFERFKGKDDDVDRILEKIEPAAYVQDPTASIQDTWVRLPC